MKKLSLCLTLMLILGMVMPGATASASPFADVAAQDEDVQLVTARVTADLVRPGRVLMSARGNHWVYDSVPPINGPNEEVNPLDGMLASLIACGMYIYEAFGIEEGIETNNLSASVTGEIDGRGVAGFDVNPRVRAFHVIMNVDGPTVEEAALMAEAFSLRCPIYTTLALSADIDIVNVVDGEEQEAFATEADPIVEKDEAEGTELKLGMPSASGRMIEFGRSVMSARGNHWIFDSVPPIKGPNEEVNPLDALVGALPSCGLMIYEAVSKEQNIPLHSAKATVEADLDPRGVAGADVDPRVRAFRVNMHISGPSPEEAEMMADEFSTRCPIYTTLERAAPIEITHVGIDDIGAILEVDFTYDFDSAEEYIAEVSPLAEAYAEVDGLRWKAWTLNEDEQRAGAVYHFESAEARSAYLESELAATVAAHPALSDFRVQEYEIMRTESLVTNGPITSVTENSGDGIGTMLQVNFSYNVSTEEYVAEVAPLAEQFAAAQGLRWKIWALEEENSQFSGILFFDTAEDVAAFAESELAETLMNHPALSDFTVTPYSILGEESLTTHAPVGVVGESE